MRHGLPEARSLLSNSRAELVGPALLLSYFIGSVACATEPFLYDELVVSSLPAEEALPVVVDSFRPTNLSQVVQSLPGMALAVNSRGETFVSLRARSDRETTLVIDGLPVRDPWDARIDLSGLPAGMVGDIDVQAWGNTRWGSGSAIRITTPEPEGLAGSMEFGDLGFARLSLSAAGETSFVALESSRRDGLPLAPGADLESQQNDEIRNNSQREQVGLYHRSKAALSGLTIQTGLLVTSARYGVAPEGHVPSSEARLWQVPNDQRHLATASLGRQSTNGQLLLRGWGQRTRRRIETFADPGFNVELARQRNAGSSVGGSFEVDEGGLGLGASYERQRQEQSEGDEPEATFARDRHSAWLGFTSGGKGALNWSTSGRWDGYVTQRAGGRPATRDRGLVSGDFALAYASSSPLRWRTAFAKLGRLPSQRELYGGALGRFAVNDDLRPEEGYAFTVAVATEQTGWALKVEPFAERWESVIDQRTVTTDAGLQRQRFNAEGYRSVGVDVVGRWQFGSDWSVQALATLMDVKRREDSAPLIERPERTGKVTLRFAPERGLGFDVVARHRGAVRSFDAAGRVITLAGGQIFGSEINYRTSHGVAFARWDNVADQRFLPQAGLPEPGRLVRFGWAWGAN